MRRPGMMLQRQMIAVAALAILLVAGKELGPDVYRRWEMCRGFATAHTAYSQHCLMLAAKGGGPGEARQWRERAAVEAGLSRQYRLARACPWRLYTLVD